MPRQRPLAAGEVHVYRTDLIAGSRWLITATQVGIDVVVSAEGGDQPELTVDAPIYRQGTESLLLPPAAGEFRVTVRPASEGVGPGRYEIAIRELDDTTPGGRKRLAAEAAMTDAARLNFQATAEARRAAAESYHAALALWRELAAPRREAETLFGLGVLHTSLGEPRPAIDFYRLALPLLRTLADRSAAAIALSDMGFAHWRLGENERAQALLEEARLLQRELGNRYGEAMALNNLCLGLHAKGDLRAALACYQQALESLRDQGEQRMEAQVLTSLGSAYHNLGEPQLALDHHRRSLELHRAFDNRRQEAKTLNNMAVVYRTTGAIEEALAHYGRALEILREVEDVRQQGVTLSNIGFAYYSLGETERAASYLQQSIGRRRAAGDRRGESITLNILGRMQTGRGATALALELHRKALELRRAVGDRRGEAGTLNLMGQNLMASEDAAGALDLFDQALEIFTEVDDRRGGGDALHGRGEALLLLGEPREAAVSLRRALDLRRATRQRSTEALTLHTLASAERRLGRPEQALRLNEAALEIIESLRVRISAPDLRASYLGAQARAYELHVDLLMDLDAADPRAGFARRALEASERGRARSLLDLLSRAGADLRRGVDPALRERQNVLLERLNAKATRQLTLASRGQVKDQLEIYSVVAELDDVEAEIRRQSPRYAELAHPRPRDLAEIQRLLDADTLLLEYALGGRRSFLWTVTAETFASFELPAREEIDDLAGRVVRGLRTVSARAEASETGAERALSELLLGPLADQLDGQRLVVVADGALHYLPFGALPAPGRGSGEPLISRHEVVYLPSASALAVQRVAYAERDAAPKWAAVLADPVFDPRDPRVDRPAPALMPAASDSTTRQPRDPAPSEATGTLAFDRLPATRREAAGIAELAPAEETLTALGFEADRSLVLGGGLRGYRILHFATHGVIDARRPELSGLALSLYDRRGDRREGFVRLRDLYNLELEAELVVLSGCRTALGREVRGEGLAGLTRGFMFAGVPRVVASLWRVEDRATAELMAGFYRAMRHDGMRPAAALRQAQRSIREQKRWRDPYYWGAFVLQGDWR